VSRRRLVAASSESLEWRPHRDCAWKSCSRGKSRAGDYPIGETMTLSRFTTSHVRTPTAKGFTDVAKDFESRLGRFDPTILHSDSSSKVQEADVRSRIEAMAGSSGFMLFSTTDHGALLTLFDKPRKAIQYLVGNPLIALQMTRRNPGA